MLKGLNSDFIFSRFAGSTEKYFQRLNAKSCGLATHGVVAPGDPVPLQSLRETVRIFEASYPNAARLINRFFAMLSGTGI